MTGCRLNIIGLLLLGCLLGNQAFSQKNWPRFRGPNGSGLSRATTVPVEWTEDDFNWRVKLPAIGHSSPVIWADRIFLTSAEEATGRRYVVCVSADEGEILWVREFPGPKHRKHKLNSFASSTPAVDAHHVYLYWGSPESLLVQALTHEGREVWRKELGSFKGGHGFGVSPIVHAGRLIIPAEQEGPSSLMALETETGQVSWRLQRESKVTYSTPCVFQPEGGAAQLIFTNWKHGITAVDPQSGTVEWEISVFDQDHVETAIGSPIVTEDLILGTCGWLGYATHTVAVRPNGSAPQGAEEVYRFDRGAPLSTTPLVVENLLFLWADDGIVTCADATTGELLWKKRVGGTYYGSPVAAGGAVYCVSRKGEAVVLAASAKYRVLGRNRLGEGSHSTPAIAEGTIYLRTFSHLISLGGRTTKKVSP